MSERPAYLELSAADVERWRGDVVTVQFLDWIMYEASKAKDEIAKNVSLNAFENARIVAGRLQALGQILRAVEVPAELPEVDEPNWKDPAARPRPPGQKDQQLPEVST